MQTPLQLDIWLQSYAGFDNKNKTSPTSDSFLLIMSHIYMHCVKGLANLVLH